MATYRISLDTFSEERYPGGWAEIKGRRSWADSKRIDSASVSMTAPGAGSEMFMRADLLGRGIAILESAIVAWSLPIPPTRAGFESDDFDDDLGEWLIDQIDAHYASERRTTDARKNSAAPSTPL